MKKLQTEAFAGIILMALLFGAIYFIFPPVEEKSHLLSVSQEKKLGDKLIDMMIDKKSVIKDGALYELTDSIYRLLQNVQSEEDRALPYQLHLVRSSEINAMAMPGGHLVVYTGIIDMMEHPDELAGVIAHEMGHIVHRHIIERMAGSMGIGVLLTAISGDPTVVHEVLKMALNSAFSRKQEAEADQYAFELMAKAGFSPRKMAALFHRFNNMSNIDIPYILRSHPHDHERIEASLNYELPEDFEEGAIELEYWEEMKGG
jgi:beta-barrel assembly-enhancing protease